MLGKTPFWTLGLGLVLLWVTSSPRCLVPIHLDPPSLVQVWGQKWPRPVLERETVLKAAAHHSSGPLHSLA